MKNQLLNVFATLSCLISFSVIFYAGLRVQFFLPGLEHGLQPVLAGALINVLLVMPWCTGPGMT